MSRKPTDDELFEQFLKESVSDDSVDLGGSDHQSGTVDSQSAQKPTTPWWDDDKCDEGRTERAPKSPKTFRKSLRRSQPIEEEDQVDPGNTGLQEERGEAEVKMTNKGLDTLEEEEEKARFFAQLEAEALSDIDYSKLNRELDLSSSTIDSDLRKAGERVEQSDDGITKSARHSPDSPHYSEDFEDEDSGREPLHEESNMSPLLTKGQIYVQSGCSDMEALHEAYMQISHDVRDSEDQKLLDIAMEGKEPSSRCLSSDFPPQHSRESLQPASTAESDLPTAEELLRPIRPERDHIGGFTVQPDSAAEPVQSGTPWSMERTFLSASSPEPHLKRPVIAEPAVQVEGARSPDSVIHSLTWSIRDEVQRLMQDHNPSSQTGKAKKQASSGPRVGRPSSSIRGKPTVAPVRSSRVQGRPTVASRMSGPRSAVSAKTLSSVPHTPKSPKSQDYCSDTEADLKVHSDLKPSTVDVPEPLVDPSSHPESTHAEEVKGPQDTRLAEHITKKNNEVDSHVIHELRVQLNQKDKQLETMHEHMEELQALKKQNYLLQSKLHSAEEECQKSRWMDAADPAAKEKLQLSEKEIREQEMLIKGYQQENEKLYFQMKAQQAKSKANEEAMFRENQRLLRELSLTREHLSKTPQPLENVCPVGHSQQTADLLAQIYTFQRNEAKLTENIHKLEQEKQTLEVKLQLMKTKRHEGKGHVVPSSGGESLELSVLEERHREKVAALQQKFQEQLEKDAGRLKEATTQTHQLTEQGQCHLPVRRPIWKLFTSVVKKLQKIVEKRSSQQQRTAEYRTAETKRIQDLERQVKVLEGKLKTRNPTLSALVCAANMAGNNDQDAAAMTSPQDHVKDLLKREIQHLRHELENQDNKAKQAIQALEKRFQSTKLQYEHQISEVQQQLAEKQQLGSLSSGTEEWLSQIQVLKEELQHLNASHQDKEKSLHGKIEFLKQQLKQQAQTTPGRHQRQAEEAYGVRIERLNQEVATKTRTIQELTRTVQRLQKERSSMLCVSSPQHERKPKETHAPPISGEDRRDKEIFPAFHFEKAYEPSVYSDVVQEEVVLRQRLEALELQNEKEKDSLKAEVAQAKDELRRMKEHFEEQHCTMKKEHLRELDHLHAAHAMKYASSKVAELANELNTQQIMVKHLQDQLKEFQETRNALRVSRTRENILQDRLMALLTELNDAKKAQSPVAKLIGSLEKKILNMELRHQQREKELQQVIDGPLQADQQSEAARWKHLAQNRSRDLGIFLRELDYILDIVRYLQSRGTVVHIPESSGAVSVHQQLLTESPQL
ncbi:centrosomal protein of 162 kDa isoform X2 [Thalassophryne amazonica]|uniref:centrosomal protein of 162 kDa isoform X2 n=1 Tax=Thalassophryne amazonica TaxID=390379 RepID=UPI0014722FAD|nr:centrosomal protein of 162 kDa isoform X2 [Thalassophryne amazonica]